MQVWFHMRCSSGIRVGGDSGLESETDAGPGHREVAVSSSFSLSC